MVSEGYGKIAVHAERVEKDAKILCKEENSAEQQAKKLAYEEEVLIDKQGPSKPGERHKGQGYESKGEAGFRLFFEEV